MRKRESNFFEEHVEKMVLAVVGIVFLWLLITRVIISPNRVEYSGRKLGPGEIDLVISREARLLKNKLDSSPEPLPPYKRRVDAFVGLVDLPIGDIDTSLNLPLPIYGSIDFTDKRKYHIPWIGQVSDVALEYIRAVAYVPVVEIDRDVRYDMIVSRPDDIDFVTVEAKFDVRGLYERFYYNFAGAGVEQENWRDPCLAEPVFAAVQLQRQELNDDDSWSQWYVVPRTKIDPYKKMFESVEDGEELPTGGVKVRLLQFDNEQVQMALLQPQAYKIASMKEEWFPPSLHKEYVEYKNEIEMEKLRRAKEAERTKLEEEREKIRKERKDAREERLGGTTYGTRFSGDQYGTRREGRTGIDSRYGATGRIGTDTRLGRGRDRGIRRDEGDVLTRKEEREQRAREKELRLEEMRLTSARTTIDELYKKLDGILITKKTELAKLREQLVFWAHDDTLEPGKTYRYRIRLGVFNPVAGTNQFQEENKDLKNQIVLWSDFSEIEQIVKVPGTLYFFPQDVKEVAKVVTVQVSKYTLGNWYSKNFAVKPGEVIGAVADVEPMENKVGVSSGSIGAPVSLDTIDYGTGAVLVDVVSVDDWSGGKNMYARHYYNMLYSFDGVVIEQIPVSPRYWDEDLRNQLNVIRKSQQEPKEPLRGWDMKLTSMALAPELEYRPAERIDRSTDRRRERPSQSRPYIR